MAVNRMLCTLALAISLATSVCAGEAPPAPPNSTLALRAVLNEDTKGFVLLAIKEPETQTQANQVIDSLLQETEELTYWRYQAEPGSPVDFGAPLRFYEDWARKRDLRRVVTYIARQGGNEVPSADEILEDTANRGLPPISGEGRLYWKTGEEGGLFAIFVEAGVANVLWAEGDLDLGPILAPLLGLPPLSMPTPQDGGVAAEPALPELPEELPLELLQVRLELTSEDLMPIVQELAARAQEAPEDLEIAPSMRMLFQQGPTVLRNVHGLVGLVFSTPDSWMAGRVQAAAQEYADARAWTQLLDIHDDAASGQLYAKLGDEGGAMVVGTQGDTTVLLITEGAPDLMAIMAAFG